MTVGALATGTVGSGKYGGKWLLRPGAASGADRTRVVTETGFSSTTGMLTHAGAAYSDTTVGTEVVEIHEFEPGPGIETAINEAVRHIRRVDTLQFQSRPDGRYDLAAFDWLDEPSLVTRFGRRAIATLTPNRQFDRWGTIHTDGAFRPDSWALAGSGGVFARSTTTRRGRYSLSIQRVGTDVTCSFTFPVRFTEAADDDFRGEVITGSLVGRSAQANSLRVRVTSETASGSVLSTTNSSYHTGGGAWEELSAVHTVDSAAEQCTISARIEVNETALLDELYAAATNGVTDALRRDDTVKEWIGRPYEYEQNPLVWLGPRHRGAQIVMESRRTYPTFDATRLSAGSADSDQTDCPLDLVAHKALALFFASRADENVNMEKKAAEYARKADDLQAQHLYEPGGTQPGTPMFSGRAYGARGRVA